MMTLAALLKEQGAMKPLRIMNRHSSDETTQMKQAFQHREIEELRALLNQSYQTLMPFPHP